MLTIHWYMFVELCFNSLSIIFCSIISCGDEIVVSIVKRGYGLEPWVLYVYFYVTYCVVCRKYYHMNHFLSIKYKGDSGKNFQNPYTGHFLLALETH